jgi:hypothetical protein
MKTFKIVVVLLFILGFASNYVNGQKPDRVVLTLPVTIYFDCMDQNLVGELVFERNWMNNHYQSKISGTLTGEDDIEYSVDIMNEVNNFDWVGWLQKGINYTRVYRCFVRLEGKLVGSIIWNYHFTFDANGEPTVETDNYRVQCK